MSFVTTRPRRSAFLAAKAPLQASVMTGGSHGCPVPRSTRTSLPCSMTPRRRRARNCARAGKSGRRSRARQMRVSLFGLAFLLLAGAVRADGSGPLTWEDSVAEASRVNPTLVSSRLSVDASRTSYYSSFNGFLPSLTLSNSVSESSTLRKPSYSASASAAHLVQRSRTASIGPRPPPHSAEASRAASATCARRCGRHFPRCHANRAGDRACHRHPPPCSSL